MKEHCARVQLPAGVTIPQSFLADGFIHRRSEAHADILMFTNWSAERHRELEQACGLSLAPEWLSLEDIFLEMHA